MLELQDKLQQNEAEERGKLKQIAGETMREMFAELPPPDDLWPPQQSSTSSAACAVAIPAPASLSESEPVADALVVIADCLLRHSGRIIHARRHSRTP